MLSQLPRTVEEIESLLSGTKIYPASVQHAGGETICFAQNAHQHYIVCIFNPQAPPFLRDYLGGETQDINENLAMKWGWPGHSNARKLRELFPWTAPQTLSTKPALAVRDFTGLAAPALFQAHAAKEYNFALVFEASPREMATLSRTLDEAIDNPTFAALAVNYRHHWGARAAELESAEEQEKYQKMGFTEFSFAGDVTDFQPAETQAWQRAVLRVVENKSPDLFDEIRKANLTFLDVWTQKSEGGAWRFRDRIYRLLLDNEELHYTLIREESEPIFTAFHNNPLRNE